MNNHGLTESAESNADGVDMTEIRTQARAYFQLSFLFSLPVRVNR